MVRPFLLLSCLLSCLSLVGVPLAAQQAQLQAGARVRVRSQALGNRPVIATVIASESDTLVLKPDKEAAGLILPWDSVGTIEIGGWRTHALEGAVVGVLGGLLVAAVASPCDYDDCTLEEDLLELTYNVMPDPGIRFGVLGFLGLVGGALLGSEVRTETWRPLVRANLLAGGSTAVGLSFSF